MKTLPLILIPISLAVVGCNTPLPPGPYPVAGENPPAVSGQYVPPQEGVRLPETVKAYDHNPYRTAKGNMQSSGTIFTVEQSATWDLHPGASTVQRVPDPAKAQTPTRTQVEEGPLDAAPELPERNVSMPAEMEQELAKQKQMTRVLNEQLDAQRQLTAEWKKTQAAAAVIIEENQKLKQRVQELKDAEAARLKKEAEETQKSKWNIRSWFSKSNKPQVTDTGK
jgi:hypothetical protein